MNIDNFLLNQHTVTRVGIGAIIVGMLGAGIGLFFNETLKSLQMKKASKQIAASTDALLGRCRRHCWKHWYQNN